MASKPFALIGAILVSVVFQTMASAQVVRQGDPSVQTDPNAFKSPMVIEASFVAADRSIWGDKSWHEGPDYKALGKYTVDGISLRGNIDPKTKETGAGIAMQAREVGNGILEVTVGLWLFNPKNNHDKRVTVLLDVLDGSQVVAHATSNSLEIEDKGRPRFEKFSFTMPVNVLKAEPAMKMRLTVTTKDD